MRKILLLLVVCIAATACSTTRRISTVTDPASSWVGSSTTDILETMGDPVRIEADGKDGSVLVYESLPGDSDPNHDFFDPQGSERPREYAHFYLNREGVCYHVDTNRNLPYARRMDPYVETDSGFDILFDFVILPLLFISVLF